ncbi:MAG: hypothetical protein PHQ40_18590 [Anaerolineaceae bacterium]|nr:hypothetical protein [Anaerolineaceae bacterium]
MNAFGNSSDQIPQPLVLAPTRIEFGVVRKALRQHDGRSLRLACCGMGESRAREFCQALDPATVTVLVLLGWAGGLTPDLPAGALVCASAALRQDQPAVPCESISLPNSTSGPILTVPKALFTPQEKHSARLTGAVAAEMEAYPLAQWAQSHHIPLIHVRLILDAWDEALPQVAPGPASALRSLAQLPDAWRLFRRIRATNSILVRLARDVVAAI